MKKLYFTISIILFGLSNAQLYTPNGNINGVTSNPQTENVGVGIANPTQKLDVRGGNILSGNIDGTGGALFLGNPGHGIIREANDIKLITAGEGVIKFSNNLWNNGNTEFMRIANNGNVGIGTATPNAKLAVNGDFRIFSGNNEFFYNGAADIILRYSDRGSGGRAIVHDTNNTLVLNFGGDYSGGVRIGNVLQVNNSGAASLLGKFETKEIKVTTTPTADFVFATDYDLPKLEEVEKHIKEKKHLPGIASAKQMEKEGVNIGEFQIKLLQKIEELTLYSIEQNKQLKELKEEINKLKNKK